jgi:Phosphotransferase enzyme family
MTVAPVAPTISDRFGDDPSMAFARDALHVERAQERLRIALGTDLEITAMRVTRHKPGRRALIEYTLKTPRGPMTVLGKIRAKGLDLETHRLHETLWHGGFDEGSPDGLCVPEPLGTIPEWHMTVQRKVEGVPVTQHLDPAVMGRVADLMHKLHLSPFSSCRQHAIQDELRILQERLEELALQHPAWRARLERILEASQHRAADLPEVDARLIHRDCYADQLIDGNRLYLIDLDLCCTGDPALDIGNFIGHLSELALRTTGQANAFFAEECALENRFVELAGVHTRRVVRIYAALTLVRHIAISQCLPERRFITPYLIEHCEARLGLRARSSASPEEVLA